MHALFPVGAVKLADVDALHGARIETVRHDTDSVRIRARNVKTLHSAAAAKVVLGLVRVERVRTEVIVTFEQREIGGRNDKVTVLLFHANAATVVQQHFSQAHFPILTINIKSHDKERET